jgi:ABC-type xylose transport system permease subunit
VGALILTVLDTMLTRLAVGESIRQLVAGSILLALAWVYVSSTRRASARRRTG